MPSWARINIPELPEFPAFSHAAVAGGDVYVSGMLGIKPDLSGVVEGGIQAETKQAFHYIDLILRACHSGLDDIVKVSVYMTDLGEWDAMNDAYVEVFRDHTPARIAVGCSSLLFGASVEFDCTAYRGS